MSTIFIPKWIYVLPACYGGLDILKVSRNLKITYSQVYNIISDLEGCGWITKKKVGRHNVLNLTPKGEKIATLCQELIKKTEVIKK